mgnify:CR=1 FL=1
MRLNISGFAGGSVENGRVDTPIRVQLSNDVVVHAQLFFVLWLGVTTTISLEIHDIYLLRGDMKQVNNPGDRHPATIDLNREVCVLFRTKVTGKGIKKRSDAFFV